VGNGAKLPRIQHRNRLPPDEYWLLQRDKKVNGLTRGKFSTQKVIYGEYTFGNPWEFHIWKDHYRFKRLRKIKHIKMFPVFPLYSETKIVGHYVALLSYTDCVTGLTVVVDAKTPATMTRVARLKFRMFLAQYLHELKVFVKPKGWVHHGFKS